MALSNYDRILFVGNTDNIADTPASASVLATYLSDNGFTGAYLAQGNFNTNGSDINSLIGTISVSLVGAVGGNSSEAADVVTYNSSFANKAKVFIMYNQFWDSETRFSSWLPDYNSITGISSSFWIGQFQTTQSQDIRIDGYTEIESAKEIIKATNTSSLAGVLLDVFNVGVPKYTTANDKTVTNTLRRLDILADAVRQLRDAGAVASNFKLPIHFYYHVGQAEYGSSEDYSGYSLASLGTFDAFESKVLKTVVDRTTKFQRTYLDIKGFAYYKYPYAQAALNIPDCISSLSISPGNATAYLSWTRALTGGTPSSYDIYIDTTPNPSASASPINVSSTNYTVSGLTSNTTYYVAIIAKNSVGSSGGCTTYSFTTTNVPVGPAIEKFRILYLNDISTYLGNSSQENIRLNYAKTIGANVLQLYGAVPSLSVGSTPLAAFIKKAKQNYDINKVSCVVFSRYQASHSIAYNLSRVDPLERFDDFNIENEFWFGDYRLNNRFWVTNAVNGASYTIRINGIDYTVTSATTNESTLAQQLYNQIVSQNGSTTLYNGVRVSYTAGNSYVSLTAPAATTLKTAEAPITDNRNIFTSGGLVAVSSSYNPGKLYAPFYTEVKYNGVVVSGDRSPYRTSDDVNYDQSKIAVEDKSCTTTLHWLALAKWLHETVSASNSANGTNWTVSAYVQNYTPPGRRWASVEAELMVQYIDLYEATNYVTTIDAPRAINSQLNLLANACVSVGKPSQSFTPIWSAESIYNGVYLPTYSASFYPNMSGGLDQAESDWSASYASNATPATRSYLDLAGTSYFSYLEMQTAYKYP